MALLARDVMQTGVIQVGPETPLVDIQRLFVEEGISGAPVVDETGRLLGVIASSDLLRAVTEERDTAVAEPRYYRENLEFSGPDWNHALEDFQDRLAELTVADAMTEGGATVAPDTSIPEVARLMRAGRIHRVFVVDGEALVGIITSFDLVALLEKA
jgi:CBS domain-containing protein